MHNPQFQTFQSDIARVYTMLQERENKIADLYQAITDTNHPFRTELTRLCAQLEIPADKKSFFALIDRIANLKTGGIIEILKQHGKTQNQILESCYILLAFIQDFYHTRHLALLQDIKANNLLTPFYQNLLFGVHTIGVAMSGFFTQWSRTLIDTQNEKMKHYFGEKVFSELIPTIDKEYKNGTLVPSDRSYSIAFLDDSNPKSKEATIRILPFCEALSEQVRLITNAIDETIQNLESLQDEIYNAKEAYLAYLKAIKAAYLESNCDNLIARWQEVDTKWMAITTPFQIGHPLEYYEDNLRHCVAPEWDLRLSSNEAFHTESTKQNVKNLFDFLCVELQAPHLLQQSVESAFAKTHFYIGSPLVYYGADLNGLFSAQVVPNDEQVSKKFGKKIFAFPDRILKANQKKPKMRLHYEIFPKDFLQEARDILYNDEALWLRIYDISTNGHELGHILWIDEYTQTKMNIQGEFKNIEEFKATCGGLVAYFYALDSNPESNTTQKELQALMSDTIRRAVGLMAWRGQEEVLPYYCEGLIHLHGAFSTKVLTFDSSKTPCLSIHTHNYPALKQWYIQTYCSLARHYIQCNDAKHWLECFVRQENGIYFPILDQSLDFVEWYWHRYQQIGQEILA